MPPNSVFCCEGRAALRLERRVATCFSSSAMRHVRSVLSVTPSNHAVPPGMPRRKFWITGSERLATWTEPLMLRCASLINDSFDASSSNFLLISLSSCVQRACASEAAFQQASC